MSLTEGRGYRFRSCHPQIGQKEKSGRHAEPKLALPTGPELVPFQRIFPLCIQQGRVSVVSVMKNLFTVMVAALATAAFATTTFAGSFGSCTGEGGEKAKDKAEAEAPAQS